LVVGAVIAAADMAWALLDAASVDAPSRIHNPLVAPVNVTVDYGTERTVPPVLVERVSPREIASPIEGQENFFERAAVFADVRISAESEIWNSVQQVTLRISGRELSLSGTSLRDAATPSDNGLHTVSLRDALGISGPGSRIPLLGAVLNYRGDLTVIFWLFLRTIIAAVAVVVMWRLRVTGFFRDNSNTARCFAWSWLIFGVLATVLSKSWMQERPLVVSDLASVLYLATLLWLTISSAYLIHRFALVPDNTADVPAPLRRPATWTRAAHWAIAVSVVAMAAILRIWNLDYLQGADSFNLTAALALNDTGSFAYARNLHLTHGFAWLMRTFGTSLGAVRTPLVALSLLVMLTLPLLAKPFGVRAAILSLLLYALSPVAIEHASTIREYGENLVLATLLLGVLTYVFLRMRPFPRKAVIALTLVFLTLALSIHVYGGAVNNVTVASTIQVTGFYVVGLIVVLLWPRAAGHRIVLVVLLFAAFVGLVAIAPNIGPFERELWVPVNFFRMYLDPFVDKPMQWFSFQALTPLVPAIIVLSSMAKRRNRDLSIAMSLAFWGSLLLFSLRMGDTSRSRYVYHLLPLYLVLFSSGIDQLWWSLRMGLSHTQKRKPAFFAFWLGVLALVWPANTAIATRHVIPDGQDRWVTSLRHENYVRPLYHLLELNGLSARRALVLERERPDNYLWMMKRPVTETYSFAHYSNTPYDIAQGVYYEHPDWGAFGLTTAVIRHNQGFYLLKDRPGRIPRVVAEGTELSFVTSAHGFTIYRW